MRKLLAASLIIGATVGASLAQGTTTTTTTSTTTTQTASDIPNMGRAPKAPNGVGRLDLRVFDENGNPVSQAKALLKSKRTDGFLCESFGATDARGVLAMPPLHMGALRLKVQAKGYRTQEIDVPVSSLSEPVRVTLARKK